MSYPYVPAKYQGATRGDPTLIVLHSMEAPEKGDSAESTARFFQNIDRPASAHYDVDNNSIVQSVKDNVVAYAAPGANSNGLHIEQAGYAKQSAAEWLDPYGVDLIKNVAGLVVEKCRQYNIPPTWLMAADLLAGRTHGVTTHNEVSKAFHKSTHWDPGPNYPAATLMFLVTTALNPQPAAPAPAPVVVPVVVPTPPPDSPADVLFKAIQFLVFMIKVSIAKDGPIGPGDTRYASVRLVQQAINGYTISLGGKPMVVDGLYGRGTADVIKWWQAAWKIPVSGIVNSETANKLWP